MADEELIQHVVFLKANPIIITLDASRNRIGAAGAEALAQNTTLTTLDVRDDRRINDEGGYALANMLPHGTANFIGQKKLSVWEIFILFHWLKPLYTQIKMVRQLPISYLSPLEKFH
jgi:hypothetical protein